MTLRYLLGVSGCGNLLSGIPIPARLHNFTNLTLGLSLRADIVTVLKLRKWAARATDLLGKT